MIFCIRSPSKKLKVSLFMEYTQALIQKIREAKEAKHLTNEDISEMTNIPETTVSRILSGASKRPGFENVLTMAIALGVSVDKILGAALPGEEPPQRVEVVAESYASVLKVKDDLIIEKDKLIEELRATHARYIKNNAKLTTVVFVLGAVLCLCCVGLTAYFVYDVFNGDVGVFRY